MERQLGQVLFLVFVIVTCTGCQDDNSTSLQPNPFGGNWNIAFAGASVGDGEITIQSNGLFNGDLVSGASTLFLEGGVSGSGVLKGGVRSESRSGAIDGSFSGSTGSGTWQLCGAWECVSGAWTATRNEFP